MGTPVTVPVTVVVVAVLLLVVLARSACIVSSAIHQIAQTTLRKVVGQHTRIGVRAPTEPGRE